MIRRTRDIEVHFADGNEIDVFQASVSLISNPGRTRLTRNEDAFRVVCQSREPVDLMKELQKNADENGVKRKEDMVKTKKEDDPT